VTIFVSSAMELNSAISLGTDIFDAIQRGNLEHCVTLIKHDQSLLARKGWSGFTPLHYAAFQGNRGLAELLLQHGADPNLPNDAGQTPFHFACRYFNQNEPSTVNSATVVYLSMTIIAFF
ncbi:UNVERIFIED_CONTAM: hypothetical protein FKN15_070094, partial [Acipenser sinensis]